MQEYVQKINILNNSRPAYKINMFFKEFLNEKQNFQMNWAFGVNENRMLTLVDCLVTHGFEKSV